MADASSFEIKAPFLLVPNYGKALCLFFCESAPLSVLWCHAHSLLENALQQEVQIDDTQQRSEIRTAVQAPFASTQYFPVAVSDTLLGIGVSARKKDRIQAAKLALVAVSVAAGASSYNLDYFCGRLSHTERSAFEMLVQYCKHKKDFSLDIRANGNNRAPRAHEPVVRNSDVDNSDRRGRSAGPLFFLSRATVAAVSSVPPPGSQPTQDRNVKIGPQSPDTPASAPREQSMAEQANAVLRATSSPPGLHGIKAVQVPMAQISPSSTHAAVPLSSARGSVARQLPSRPFGLVGTGAVQPPLRRARSWSRAPVGGLGIEQQVSSVYYASRSETSRQAGQKRSRPPVAHQEHGAQPSSSKRRAFGADFGPRVHPHESDEWGDTVFQIVNKLGKVEPLTPWQGGSPHGPFLAFGHVVCTDYHVMIEAHVADRNFQRAGLSLDPEKHCFPHMTLGKLENGQMQRIGNTTWWSTGASCSTSKVDMTSLTKQMTDRLKRNATVFRLIPVHIHQDFSRNRYRITGGEGLDIFFSLQEELRLGCAALDAGTIAIFSEPHISYEYPAEVKDWGRWDGDRGESRDAQSSLEGSQSSMCSSLQEVLSKLSLHKLEKLRNIFVQHRLSASILPCLSVDDLEKAGIVAVGDQKRVGNLVADLQKT